MVAISAVRSTVALTVRTPFLVSAIASLPAASAINDTAIAHLEVSVGKVTGGKSNPRTRCKRVIQLGCRAGAIQSDRAETRGHAIPRTIRLYGSDGGRVPCVPKSTFGTFLASSGASKYC